MIIFKSARINLTAWYLIIIMALSISMSVSVYQQVVYSTERALDFHEQRIKIKLKGVELNNPPSPYNDDFQKPINEETAREIREDTLLFLFLINLALLICAGGLGYFLAGKTLNPIEEMVEKQKRFIADAAHEIKTPLTAIKTTLEVHLRNKNLSLEDAKKSMKEVLEEVDELSVLSFRLLDEGKYNSSLIKFEKVSLSESIENVLKIFDSRIKNKNLRVEKSFLDNIYINGDKSALKELISILIDNAVKFNNLNGFIKIKLEEHRKNIQIEFTNSAEPILEEDMIKIFDRFYKIDKSRNKTNEKGFGLGLSIAKEIIDKHHGRIEVRNNKDESVSFVVYLPRG